MARFRYDVSSPPFLNRRRRRKPSVSADSPASSLPARRRSNPYIFQASARVAGRDRGRLRRSPAETSRWLCPDRQPSIRYPQRSSGPASASRVPCRREAVAALEELAVGQYRSDPIANRCWRWRSPLQPGIPGGRAGCEDRCLLKARDGGAILGTELACIRHHEHECGLAREVAAPASFVAGLREGKPVTVVAGAKCSDSLRYV